MKTTTLQACCVVKIQAPVCINGDDIDIAFEVTVDYSPICNGDGVAEDVAFDRDDIEVESAALTVARVDLNISSSDGDRLFSAWLLTKGNRRWLSDRCASHWDAKGREKYETDREVRNA